MNGVIPNNLPDISYYANQEGELTPIIAGANPTAVINPPLLLGVTIDGQLYPIFDRRQRWIMVDTISEHSIPVSIHLRRIYRHLFPVHILQRLQINNDGEYYMTRDGHPNAQHIEPRDGHPNGQHIDPRDRRPNGQQIDPRNVRRRHN